MPLNEPSLRRREFLARTAAAAGISASVAASLSPGTLMSEAAARTARRSALPAPRNCPVEHIVVLMMENRSFDHYFGWVENADATQDAEYLDAQGAPVSTVHHSELGESSWQGCGHPDPGHGWTSGRVQKEKGFLADGTGNDIFALTYFNEGELGFIHDAAKAYTLYDRFHCSLMASTWPNRYYMWSAQSGGIKNNDPPVATLGNQWDTIFDLAGRKGVSATYYNSDLPFSATWGVRGAAWTQPIAKYYADCALGTLPNISFVDPPFRDGGGFDGNSADEHPHGDVRLGQAFMADVVNAFVQSPNYRKGALFIVYDEWGGFFDHVDPPLVPDDRGADGFGQMGFRIPAVAVSPWARNRDVDREARVRHGLYGFESILKFISWRWGLGKLTLRHAEAANIASSFNWAQRKPDLEPPDLPDPTYIASKPCTIGGGALLPEDVQRHHDEMGELVDLAERAGIEVGAGRPSDLFRKPDSVRRAVLANP